MKVRLTECLLSANYSQAFPISKEFVILEFKRNNCSQDDSRLLVNQCNQELSKCWVPFVSDIPGTQQLLI